MFNKKFLVTILALGMLVAAGAAGTWASFIKTADANDGSAVSAFSTDPLTMSILGIVKPGETWVTTGTNGLTITGAIPDSQIKSMGYIRVENTGTLTGKLQVTSATFAPNYNALENDLVFYAVDGYGTQHVIYAGSNTPEYGTAETVDAAHPLAINDALPGSTSHDVEIRYKFVNTNPSVGDQGILAGQNSGNVKLGFTLTGAYV